MMPKNGRELRITDRVLDVLVSHEFGVADVAQLFNFQWLARAAAGSLFLLLTYSSRG